MDNLFDGLMKIADDLNKVAAPPLPGPGPGPEKVTIEEFFVLPEQGIFYDEDKVTKIETREYDVAKSVENFGAASIRWQNFDDPEDGPKKVVVFRGSQDMVDSLMNTLPEGLQVVSATGVRLASAGESQDVPKIVCANCEHFDLVIDDAGFGECPSCGYEDVITASGEPEVDPRVPKSEIRWLLNKVHVGTPDEEVRADIEGRAATVTDDPDLIKACGDYAVYIHNQNGQFFTDVDRGFN